MKNGDCRIPRAQQLVYKTIRREEWEKLHLHMYNFMLVYQQLELGTEEDSLWEKVLREWRKHIALPTDCETWLEDRRNARANEVIPD